MEHGARAGDRIGPAQVRRPLGRAHDEVVQALDVVGPPGPVAGRVDLLAARVGRHEHDGVGAGALAGNMGLVPPAPGFLEDLRTLTREHGALLIGCDHRIQRI